MARGGTDVDDFSISQTVLIGGSQKLKNSGWTNETCAIAFIIAQHTQSKHKTADASSLRSLYYSSALALSSG